MVKIWCEDYTDESYTDATIQDPRQFIGVPLAVGMPLTGRFPEATKLVLRSDREPLDFFMVGPMPVVSGRLKAILEQFHIAAEFYSVEVIKQSGPSLDSYWFYLNILDAIDCLEWEKSRYKSEKHYATHIERVSLSEKAPGSLALFRVARTIPSLICASDILADTIRGSGCTGVAFRKPEDWRNPMNPQ